MLVPEKVKLRQASAIRKILQCLAQNQILKNTSDQGIALNLSRLRNTEKKDEQTRIYEVKSSGTR